MWSLHVFPVQACWVSSGYSSFLPLSISMHVSLTRHSKIPRRCEFMSVSLCLSRDGWQPAQRVLSQAVTHFVNRRSVRVRAAFSPCPLALCGVLSVCLQCTIFLPRWSAVSQFSDRRINTLYPAADIHHMTCSRAFLWRVPESKIYSCRPHPSSPQFPPLRTLPQSWLFYFNDKTNPLKVCHCRGVPQSCEIQCRRLLRDCGSSLTRGHWAAGAAVNDCWESGVMIMAPCGTQFAGEKLGAELELTWPLITSCCFDPVPCAVYVCVFLVAPEGSWLVFMEPAPALNVLFQQVWRLLPQSSITHHQVKWLWQKWQLLQVFSECILLGCGYLCVPLSRS